MAAGYVFIASCFTLMALALGLLTREVFAERARRGLTFAQRFPGTKFLNVPSNT